MYGTPLVYYADGNPPPQDILKDLEKAGYKMDKSNTIAFKPNQISDLKAIISGVSLPFIYFPAENKTNWGKIAFVGGACAVASKFAFGFTSTGVAARTVAGAAQSAFYGGATGGIFSLLQSAGLVGFGIFGNAVSGLSGAGLDSMAGGSMDGEGGKSKITHKVHVKYNGLYRSGKKPGDSNVIKDFVEKQLKLPLDFENSLQYLEEIGEILFNPNKMEIELPGAIVYFETTKI